MSLPAWGADDVTHGSIFQSWTIIKYSVSDFCFGKSSLRVGRSLPIASLFGRDPSGPAPTGALCVRMAALPPHFGSPRLGLDTARPRNLSYSHINYPLRIHLATQSTDAHAVTGNIIHAPLGMLLDGSITIAPFNTAAQGLSVTSPKGFAIERATLPTTRETPAILHTTRMQSIASVGRPSGPHIFSHSLYTKDPPPSRDPERPVGTPRSRALRGASRLHAYNELTGGGTASSPRARPFRLPPMGVSPRTDTWRMALEVPPALVS